MWRSSGISVRGLLLAAGVAILVTACGGENNLSPAPQSPPVNPPEEPAATPPAPPANLGVASGNAQASLNWSTASGATAYRVKRSTASGGPYTLMGSPGATSYTDSSLTNGTTYYYVVSATNSAGESTDSGQVLATPFAPAVPAPDTPNNLAATAADAQASLTWSSSNGASSYRVKRSTNSGGPYTQVATPTATSYVDSSLTNGTMYFYIVTAANSTGESANSTQVAVTPMAPLPAIPAAPMNLVASSGNAQVGLTWSGSAGASSYRVKRSTTNGGPYTQVGIPTGASYTDTNVSNGVTYYYIVTAVNAGGESASSTQVAAAPVAPTTPAPDTPTNLAATAGNAQVSLTWSSSSGATSYRVKRSTTNGGPYTQVGNPTSTSYTDSTVSNGTTYYYVVTAVNAGGETASSTQVVAAPAAPPPPAPVAPANLAVNSGNAQVNLSWASSSGASSYRVKRATSNGGPYTQVANPTATSYVDTTVSNGTTYYYVVTAVNAGGESANSTQVVAAPVAPLTLPAIVLNLLAVAGDRQVALVWAPSLGATSYQVKRSTNNGGPYTQVATTSSLAYTDTSLTNGMNYYYVVSAVNVVGASANSAQASALPELPVAAPVTFGTWTPVTPAGVNPTANLSCGNYGTSSVQVDPAHPGHLYTLFHCQGIWKSTDYGATWTGPLNGGSNAAVTKDCAGAITIPPGTSTSAPVIYQSCIYGSGLGFWRSLDGGVNWTKYTVGPGAGRQDFYAPVADPYDLNHLLMAGHEMNLLVESADGGQTWTNVPIDSGMLQQVGTASIFFINMGNAAATRKTWLFISQMTGGDVGTWRSTNSGQNWVKVDRNEHPHGSSQIYQPDNNGVLYMAGMYSALGWGVLRSTDYGQTWTHVGLNANETVVFGTSKNIYSMFGWPQGAGGVQNPAFILGAQPGTGTWVMPGTPTTLTQGAAQIQVVNDGTRNIFVGAMWNAGMWRYIEP